MDEINKDIQAKMEFIVNQQAQFAANIQVHDERQTRLENIVTRLAEASVNRFEETDARVSALSEDVDRKFAALVDAQIKTEEAITKLAESQAKLAKSQAKLAESQTKLAESQTHTDKRLDALIDVVREDREGRNGKS